MADAVGHAVTKGRPRGAKNVPWDSIIARLRKHPGRWMLLPEMAYVNGRTISVIRRKERRALRLDDGTIRCRTRVGVVLDDRTVMCALYLKFEPRKEKPHVDDPQTDQADVQPN